MGISSGSVSLPVSRLVKEPLGVSRGCSAHPGAWSGPGKVCRESRGELFSDGQDLAFPFESPSGCQTMDLVILNPETENTSLFPLHCQTTKDHILGARRGKTQQQSHQNRPSELHAWWGVSFTEMRPLQVTVYAFPWWFSQLHTPENTNEGKKQRPNKKRTNKPNKKTQIKTKQNKTCMWVSWGFLGVFLSSVVCFVCGRGNSKQSRWWRTAPKLQLLEPAQWCHRKAIRV